MQRRLIINADGFGFTPGCNRGIVETFRRGLVKSTSVTPNFGYLDNLSETAEAFPDVSFGVHVNLSVGRPVANPATVSSLVGSDGTFHGSQLLSRIMSGRVSYRHMVRELDAQVAVIQDCGIRVSHIDGHQNRHLYPFFFEALVNVAKRRKIPAIRCHRRLLYLSDGPIDGRNAIRYYARNPLRVLTHAGGHARTMQARHSGLRAADRLITPGYADSSHKSTASFWFNLAETLPSGTSEVYCHPAYPDAVLRANAQYVDERAKEREVLCDPALREKFGQSGIELISFHAMEP